MNATPDAKSGIFIDIVVFYVLACAVAWIVWLPLIAGQHGFNLLRWNLPVPYIVAGTLGPTLAAAATQWLFHRNLRIAEFWGGLPRFLLGGGVGVLLVTVSLAVIPCAALAKGGVSVLHWSALIAVPVRLPMALIGGPLGEEPGWRGFALPRLQEILGPVAASLILGLMWAFWHLPLFALDNWTSAAFWQFALILTGLSVVMTFVWNLSGHSVLIAILLHAIFNALPICLGSFLGTAALRSYPNMETAIGASFAVVALILIIATRGRLGQTNPKSEVKA